ncbi:MAG: Antitoxin HicB [Pseudomonadota bacterium]|jgi:antitoxin HicB
MVYMYKAHLASDPDDGFLVTFPDMPEALTHGKTRAEALESAREALGFALRSRIKDNQPIPHRLATDGIDVYLSPDDALKVAVIQAFAASGMSKTELARRLGRRETEARRILDPYHATGLPLLEAALSALGKTILVTVIDTKAA